TGTGQRFNVQNRAGTSTYNLSGQTVTIRAYAPGAMSGDMSVFFRSPTGATDSSPTKVALATLTSGFVDVQIPVPAASGNYDPSMVDVVRIEIESDPNFGSTFQTPATVVLIDSVISSNAAVSMTFDSMPANADFGSSGARQITGSAFTWVAQYP